MPEKGILAGNMGNMGNRGGRDIEPAMDMTVDYETYLKSSRWALVKRWMLDYSGGKCERCGSRKNLQIHHRTYERLGHELLPDDLQVLCGTCHKALHESRKWNARFNGWMDKVHGSDWEERLSLSTIEYEEEQFHEWLERQSYEEDYY
jgi:hypothetical protein